MTLRRAINLLFPCSETSPCKFLSFEKPCGISWMFHGHLPTPPERYMSLHIIITVPAQSGIFPVQDSLEWTLNWEEFGNLLCQSTGEQMVKAPTYTTGKQEKHLSKRGEVRKLKEGCTTSSLQNLGKVEVLQLKPSKGWVALPSTSGSFNDGKWAVEEGDVSCSFIFHVNQKHFCWMTKWAVQLLMNGSCIGGGALL